MFDTDARSAHEDRTNRMAGGRGAAMETGQRGGWYVIGRALVGAAIDAGRRAGAGGGDTRDPWR